RHMKQKLKTFTTIFIIFCIGSFSHLQANAQSTVKVVGNHAPPFRIIEGKHFSGIYFDMLKEIAKRTNLEIEFVNQPFKRALKSMKNGTADIMFGPNKTPEREVYMQYVNVPLAKINKVFYVNPDSSVITKYEDLQNKEIAICRGNIYFQRFDRDLSLKKRPVNKYEQAIKMLVKKRVDVVIIPEQEGEHLLQQLGVKLKKSPFVVAGKSSYITISKKSSALKLQNKIQEAMKQMDADGTVQKILNRYNHH
ncbi:MAG: transporter substrate-binding domain-containing protein, partial [Psychromonas sp.]|nr:transporter substrate-binding domain-containing protein [Psychromonas sp.]